MKLVNVMIFSALISLPTLGNTCRSEAKKALAQIATLNDNFVVPKQATLGASPSETEYNYFSYMTPSYSEVQAMATVTMNLADCSVTAINIEFE